MPYELIIFRPFPAYHIFYMAVMSAFIFPITSVRWAVTSFHLRDQTILIQDPKLQSFLHLPPAHNHTSGVWTLQLDRSEPLTECLGKSASSNKKTFKPASSECEFLQHHID